MKPVFRSKAGAAQVEHAAWRRQPPLRSSTRLPKAFWLGFLLGFGGGLLLAIITTLGVLHAIS